MEKNLNLYKIEPAYLKYMHRLDYRVSVKYNNRPFVGIITMVNGIRYVLPLTSQTKENKMEKRKEQPLLLLLSKIVRGWRLQIYYIIICFL